MKKLLLLMALAVGNTAWGQFAPQAGLPGSTAIPAASSSFVAWANACTVYRGYIDIANPGAGVTTQGDESVVVGVPDGSLLSLGDSGVIVLTFPGTIYNGPGPDFAVFENGFKNPSNDAMAFLELAFAEVSSDGVNYFRFPATCNVPATTQIPGSGVYTDASLINNLAGKYIAGYGTPFDLEELKGTPGLDVDNITHVRLVDVVGSVSGHSSLDHEGRVINDPYPTNFPTGGFDLDAVGAINIHTTGVPDVGMSAVRIFPNPASDRISFSLPAHTIQQHVSIIAATGVVVSRFDVAGDTGSADIAHLPAGVYSLCITDDNGSRCMGRFVKY